MRIIAALFSILCCLIGRIRFRSILNPVSAYSCSWVMCLMFNTILEYKYGANRITDFTYFLIVLTVLFFTVGSAVADRKCETKKKKIDILNDCNINFNWIYLFNIISIFSILPWTAESIQTLVSSGIYMARMKAVVGDGGMAFMIRDLYKNAVIQPVFLATTFISVDALLFGTTKKIKHLLALTVIDMVLITITFLGRWMLLKFGIFIIFEIALRLKNTSAKLEEATKAKVKRTVIVVVIAIGIALVAITSQRSYGAEGSIIETICLYFGGSLNYLDLGIKEIENSEYYLLGFGLFPSIWDNFINLFQKISGVDFLRPQEIIYLYNAPIKAIGGEMVFTGFGTVLMNMYLDGRWIGVVLDSIFLGFIVSYMGNKKDRISHRVYNTYSLLILLLVTIQWDGNSLTSMMVYIYVWLFCKKQRVKFIWGK